MKRSEMKLGEAYAVRIVLPGQGPAAPRVEIRKRLELVDFRDPGRCIVREDFVGYDLPVGRPGRKVVKRTRLFEARISDVLATWEDWQAGDKVRTRSGGLALAPTADPELVAA